MASVSMSVLCALLTAAVLGAMADTQCAAGDAACDGPMAGTAMLQSSGAGAGHHQKHHQVEVHDFEQKADDHQKHVKNAKRKHKKASPLVTTVKVLEDSMYIVTSRLRGLEAEIGNRPTGPGAGPVGAAPVVEAAPLAPAAPETVEEAFPTAAEEAPAAEEEAAAEPAEEAAAPAEEEAAAPAEEEEAAAPAGEEEAAELMSHPVHFATAAEALASQGYKISSPSLLATGASQAQAPTLKNRVTVLEANVADVESRMASVEHEIKGTVQVPGTVGYALLETEKVKGHGLMNRIDVLVVKVEKLKERVASLEQRVMG